MAPSRTLVERTADAAIESRGEDMDFSSSSEVSADDVVEVDGLEHRLQGVEAIGPTAEDFSAGKTDVLFFALGSAAVKQALSK